MEIKNKEQIRLQSSCSTCGSFTFVTSYGISENFFNKNNCVLSFGEVINNTLGCKIARDKTSIEICKECRTKLEGFYDFKMQVEKLEARDKLEVPDSSTDEKSSSYILDIVKTFITLHKNVEITENEDKLIIETRTNSLPADIMIKGEPLEEPIEIKIEPLSIKTENEQAINTDFLDLLRNYDNSILNEELTNSSEGSSSSITKSKLPAFVEGTYFDGQKFVLRSDNKPKLLREAKKRKRNPDQWAINIQKKLRNAGQQYRSTRGYIVEARSMGEPCYCRMQCDTKVNEKNRLLNFSTYWKLNDSNQKRHFIMNHIELERPRRAMTKKRALSRLMVHFLDVVNSDGSNDRIKVCKRMFLSTFDISNTALTTAVKLHQQYLDGEVERSHRERMNK